MDLHAHSLRAHGLQTQAHTHTHTPTNAHTHGRSFVEVRETSLVWNYKHADVEFGRLQARDLLQVRLKGSILNLIIMFV